MGPWCSIEASSRTRRARGRRRGRSASSGATIERAEGLRSVVASERNAVASGRGLVSHGCRDSSWRNSGEASRSPRAHRCPRVVWRITAERPGAQGLIVAQILSGKSQAKRRPGAKGPGISARTVTSVLYGRSAAVSRPQLANGEHSNARGSSAVLAEDSVLDSLTTFARCSSAATVRASRIESSVGTVAQATTVVAELHWLAAVARPLRFARREHS